MKLSMMPWTAFKNNPLFFFLGWSLQLHPDSGLEKGTLDAIKYVSITSQKKGNNFMKNFKLILDFQN